METKTKKSKANITSSFRLCSVFVFNLVSFWGQKRQGHMWKTYLWDPKSNETKGKQRFGTTKATEPEENKQIQTKKQRHIRKTSLGE